MPCALVEFMHLVYARWRFATTADAVTLVVVIAAAGWLAARLSERST
jgi:hypothetical protein